VIEILVLQALASHADGRSEAGVTSLQRAVGLAEQEGYTRVFLDEGPPLHPLLAQIARRNPESSFVRRLLPVGEQASPTKPLSQGVVDPLSDRELEVLRLLATDLDGPAIARHLFISLNTVRTHTRSIYTKLDVTNRRAAVRRARDLNLV
jgi:LuxR family maltose regulon positive regulatory protein